MRSLLFSLLVGVPALAGDISLVADVTTTFAEGIKVSRIAFHDGPNEYCMALDQDADVSKLTNATRFTFQPLRSAIFEIQQSPLPRSKPVNAENLPEMRRTAAGLIPRDARPGKLLQETADA